MIKLVYRNPDKPAPKKRLMIDGITATTGRTVADYKQETEENTRKNNRRRSKQHEINEDWLRKRELMRKHRDL